MSDCSFSFIEYLNSAYEFFVGIIASIDFSALIPATAVIAIFLFVSKETLEFFRRRAGDKRKIEAIKRLLARECEINHWAIISLTKICTEISETLAEKTGEKFLVLKPTSGKFYLATVFENGKSGGESWVPEIRSEILTKFLLDIATLDKELALIAENAIDALAEADHVRDYLIDIERTPASLNPDLFRSGMASYSLGVLADVKSPLEALYKFCTGKDLIAHRLR